MPGFIKADVICRGQPRGSFVFQMDLFQLIIQSLQKLDGVFLAWVRSE